MLSAKTPPPPSASPPYAPISRLIRPIPLHARSPLGALAPESASKNRRAPPQAFQPLPTCSTSPTPPPAPPAYPCRPCRLQIHRQFALVRTVVLARSSFEFRCP